MTIGRAAQNGRSLLRGRFPRLRWSDHRHVGGRVGVHAEIPDVAVDSLRAQHFYQGVFTRCERRFGSQLDPTLAELLGRSRNEVLLLRLFPRQAGFDGADDSLIAFDLYMHDAEAVPGEFRGGLV